MIVSHEVRRVLQPKMSDCWFACVAMIRSSLAGASAAPGGPTAYAHRGASVLGQSLSFVNGVGPRVMAENNLVDVSAKIRFDNMSTLAMTLQEHGPLIACGRFGPGGFGHAIVVSGCNTHRQQVTVHDPAWIRFGTETKPWSYLADRVWSTEGFGGIGAPRIRRPKAGAFIADDPDAFFNQETRARR